MMSVAHRNQKAAVLTAAMAATALITLATVAEAASIGGSAKAPVKCPLDTAKSNFELEKVIN